MSNLPEEAAEMAMGEISPTLQSLQQQINTEVQARQSAMSNVPMATTTVKGETMFAADGNATSGRAVQATDSRLNNARTPTAHTHAISDVSGLQTALDGKASSGQKIIATTDLNGNYTWIFSPAFAAPPVLNCEVVSGASTFPHTINIVSFTASQAVFKVYRANTLTVSILGVSLFTNPGAVQIHLTAQPA